MRFLVDNALSPVVATGLKDAGYDALHVRDCRLGDASDSEIFEFAKMHSRTIISADTDFGFLLSSVKVSHPSFILFRKGIDRDPLKQLQILFRNLNPDVIHEIEAGSIIVFEPGKVRIRKLPLTGDI